MNSPTPRRSFAKWSTTAAAAATLLLFAVASDAARADELEKEIALDLGEGLTLEMVLIPAGTFMMGSADDDPLADFGEKPIHKVTLTKPYYMGKYEVTQEQWQAVMGNNPSEYVGPKHPVDSVSLADGQAFIAKLRKKLAGNRVRLAIPTEAQWEHACRAGGKSDYTYGDDAAELTDYAWYDENSDRSTHPVGQKKPNAWGLYDIHGNVWEWTADHYSAGYYGESPENDPAGATRGRSFVLRGGAFNTPSRYSRTAYRTWSPMRRVLNNGFRVVGNLAP